MHGILNKIKKIGRNTPPVGAITFGDFRRTEPFSRAFGAERGGAIDRYYIERFVGENVDLIKGQVLEIKDNFYTTHFGKTHVTKSDVLDIDKNNTQATIIGDLNYPLDIPNNSFDCIIFTQTLQYIYQLETALSSLYRILKPGGVLLLTVPGIGQIGTYEHEKKNFLWSFTGNSVQKLLSIVFPADTFTVNTHGNVFVAAAFLYGIGLSEVTTDELLVHDPYYQLVITAKAVKPLQG
ncbi:MAG TPA: methyltransferase domain-containing protein [Flavisolibacter sp.]|jgi:SAM-dependent methyltransferase|nr:methyltransferase domain-containing protein [Flavisolibacter sp.]